MRKCAQRKGNNESEHHRASVRTIHGQRAFYKTELVLFMAGERNAAEIYCAFDLEAMARG